MHAAVIELPERVHLVNERAPSEPDLEVVDVGRGQSFLVFSHGYPFRTVRWHFHPEYEIHLIAETSGRAFVGDYIGRFSPGNLVMTGPNLPHNWISETAPHAAIDCRCLYVQFTAAFVAGCLATFPELSPVETLLADARRGIEFTPAIGKASKPIFAELLTAQGPRRIELFMQLLGLLSGAAERRLLASAGYEPTPDDYMAAPLNHVLAHIKRNLTERLRESALAEMCGCSRSAFSRRFRRHTGMSFVQYVNRLRIHLACGLLSQDRQARVIDVCYGSGFNNLSNFNRQFLTHMKTTPTAYRDHCTMNVARVGAWVLDEHDARQQGWSGRT